VKDQTGRRIPEGYGDINFRNERYIFADKSIFTIVHAMDNVHIKFPMTTLDYSKKS